MGRVVAILNQKGGVGKTTVTLGLAAAAMAARRRVVVVDLDPQASSSWILGVDPDADRVSAADLWGRSSLDDLAVTSSWHPEMLVIPADARLLARDAARPDRLARALSSSRLVESADVVLIDCPPSLGSLTTSALIAADHALVVAEPSVLSLRGLGAVADLIDEVWADHHRGLDFAGVVVNRMPSVSSEADRRLDELARIVGRRAVWQPSIPQRVVVPEAMARREPLHALGARAREVVEVFDALWSRLDRRLRARPAATSPSPAT